MDILFVAFVAFLACGLTLFSGFGLGTILMPVEVAIGAADIVHLANNLFKLVLEGYQADARVLPRFAVPSAFAVIPGASLLVRLSGLPMITTGAAFVIEYRIETLPLVIGALIVVFALL